jgi:hypothetical protein
MKNILNYLTQLGLEDHTEEAPVSLTAGSPEQSAAVVAAVAAEPEVQQTESALTQIIEEKIGGTTAVDPITGVAGEVAVAETAPEAVAEVAETEGGEVAGVTEGTDVPPVTEEAPIVEEAPVTEGTVAEEILAVDETVGDAPVVSETTEVGSTDPIDETATSTDAPESTSADEPPVVEDAPVVEETTELEEDGLADTPEGSTETPEAEAGEETQAESEAEVQETEQAETSVPVEETPTEEEVVSETDGTQSDAGQEGTGDGEDVDVDIDVPDVDEDVSEDDIEDAEDEADLAEAAEDELDGVILDTTKSVDELEEEEVAVEEFMGVLAHGIKTNRFNAQTIALAQAKLQKLSGILGREAPCIPSMEDYTKTNMGEYYENSLESFGGFLKKLQGKRDQLLDTFAKSMNEKLHLKSVDKRITAINAQLDSEIMRVKDLEFVSHEIRLPMILRGTNGPIELVTNQIKWLGEIAGTFKTDTAYLESLAKLLNDAVGETDAAKANAIVNRAVKLSVPANSYPKGLFTKNADFDMVYTKSDKAKTGSIADDMKSLGDRAIPVLKREIVTVGTGKDSFSPRKQDLVKMLQLAKLLIGLSRGTAGVSGKGLVATIGTVNEAKSARNQSEKKAGEAEDVKRANKALSGLVDGFWDAALNSLQNYEHFQEHIAALASQLVKTVAKAKAGKKAE